jgi:signal transduction histidine kinase
LSAARRSDVWTSSDAADAISLQERERVRIGFDLHDGPAQTMSAALLQVKMLQDLEGADMRAGLAELRVTLATALEEVYELIERLGGRESNDDDLESRVRLCVDAFAARSDVAAHLAIEGDAGTVSPSLRIAIARIVQEALSNVSQHSKASRVDIRLDLSPERVVCEIADNGVGFAHEEVSASRYGREPYGLHSMRERARLLDGESVIDSVPGGGTRVRVRIPVWRT